MSDHEYTPKSKLGKWFNDRLPLLTLANHLTDYPTPKNLNYWWTFGGILTFCLITQIITGVILGMLIYLLMMATAFMGYVLPWGQMSFWGATVITNLFSACLLYTSPSPRD